MKIDANLPVTIPENPRPGRKSKSTKTDRVLSVIAGGPPPDGDAAVPAVRPASPDAAPVDPFDLEAETGAILTLQAAAGNAVLEIGQRLISVKANLPHGDWLNWLSERVEYSERTAERLMKLARSGLNPALVSDLGARKALALLALPPEERETFVRENPVGDMTARQLEQAVRERDAAKAELQSEREARLSAQADADGLRTESDRLRDAIAEKNAEIKELRERPTDVAVQAVPDEQAIADAVEAARKEERARYTRSLDERLDIEITARTEAQKKLEQARKDLREARTQADALRTERENLDKMQQTANELRLQAEQERDAAREALKTENGKVTTGDRALANYIAARVGEDLNRLAGFLSKADAAGDAELSGMIRTNMGNWIRGLEGMTK